MYEGMWKSTKEAKPITAIELIARGYMLAATEAFNIDVQKGQVYEPKHEQAAYPTNRGIGLRFN